MWQYAISRWVARIVGVDMGVGDGLFKGTLAHMLAFVQRF